jgi:transposase
MRVVYTRCCGLDVHKRTISACVLLQEASGQVQQAIRRFGTMTRDLLELADWLQDQQVTHVAMESPRSTGNPCGIFWKGSLPWC